MLILKMIIILLRELSIHNKKYLNEFIKDELMEEDETIFCGKCKQYIKSIKIIKFNFYPRILIFVLKGFTYENNINQHIKLNDYFQFHLTLD